MGLRSSPLAYTILPSSAGGLGLFQSRLAHVAGSLKLCDDPKLRALGYRTIHFKHHKYFMLYRIEDGKAYVDGIYHDSQDYENIAR